MFCPVGYVTLAELWNDFFAKFRVPLTRFAFERYGHSSSELGQIFGSPDDYCEDVFLSTLADVPIFAAAVDGRVSHLEAILDHGRSKLFAKMSPFESFLAAGDPAEAGEDGFWLRRLGSDHFETWDVTRKTLNDWKTHFGGEDDQISDRPCFHTLPFAFERERYVVPDDPPPWICDVIDEHYLPRMITAFHGHALCTEDKAARKWREQVFNAPEMPRIGETTWQKPQSIGRPNKIAAVSKAYHCLYPNGHNVTWKELIRVLEKETGLKFSEKTLRRAVSMPVKSVAASQD